MLSVETTKSKIPVGTSNYHQEVPMLLREDGEEKVANFLELGSNFKYVGAMRCQNKTGIH